MALSQSHPFNTSPLGSITYLSVMGLSKHCPPQPEASKLLGSKVRLFAKPACSVTEQTLASPGCKAPRVPVGWMSTTGSRSQGAC